ncbi:Nitric oxide synthase endothelial, partial [Dissostichus eleginoides]
AVCLKERAVSSLQSSLWHPPRARERDPWREAPQGECPQRGPGVNNVYESLLAQCRLQAVDALPLL